MKFIVTSFLGIFKIVVCLVANNHSGNINVRCLRPILSVIIRYNTICNNPLNVLYIYHVCNYVAIASYTMKKLFFLRNVARLVQLLSVWVIATCIFCRI